MKKYIIKNCPACHNYYSNVYECHQLEDCDNDLCKDCSDCVIKQIVGLCKEKIKVCEGCSKTADINIDCVEYDERGEANISRAIINLLESEEVNE